jgi:type IV pilus modification protein PilV
MIEVLVAVLVMAIGVLGVAALQMVSLQNNRAALVRTEAVILAYDMMDRIRANPVGNLPGAAYGGLGLDADPPASPNCLTVTCGAAQMVAFDQRSWKCQLGAHHAHERCTSWRPGVLPPITAQPGLPNGDGAIAVGADGVIQITVQWTDQGGEVQTVVIDSRG